jgi:transposase
MALHLRPLSEEEAKTIKKWSSSRTEEARVVQRATIIRLASEGLTVPHIAQTMGVGQKMVRLWLKRFAELGPVGLQDVRRTGSPPTYGAEVKARIIATAMTPPRELGLSFSNWTFERLATYVQEVMGIGMKRTRIFEILQAENGASASKKPDSLSESILNSPKSRTRKEA